MGRTNQDVATAAKAGRTLESSNGNFWTEDTSKKNYIYAGGWNNARIQNIISTRAPYITQIIGSYGTIIAWKDSGRWVRVDRSYSITTASKHLGTLYGLDAMYIPNDCGLDEYLRQLEGHMAYSRGYGKKLGTYRAAA